MIKLIISIVALISLAEIFQPDVIYEGKCFPWEVYYDLHKDSLVIVGLPTNNPI
jgi:hypothetical protein